MIGLTLGQQSWLRLLNIDHHEVMPGTDASMAPGSRARGALSPTLRDVAAAPGSTPGRRRARSTRRGRARLAATVERVRRPPTSSATGRTRPPQPAHAPLGVVGVVVPDLTNPVLPPIVRGIEETLWSAGIACLLADTDNDSSARRR